VEVVSKLPLALTSAISSESLPLTLFPVAWAISYTATLPESLRYGWMNGQSFTLSSIMVSVIIITVRVDNFMNLGEFLYSEFY